MRKIIFLPFYIIQYLENTYAKILQQIDPNVSECYKEELDHILKKKTEPIYDFKILSLTIDKIFN